MLQFVVVIQSLSCVHLIATPLIVAHQALLSMGFSRQEYWSELPFPSPGDLPRPGIEPMSQALASRFFYYWAISKESLTIKKWTYTLVPPDAPASQPFPSTSQSLYNLSTKELTSGRAESSRPCLSTKCHFWIDWSSVVAEWLSRVQLFATNLIDCSKPGFPALYYLLEFGQIHVHWVSDAI